MLSILLTGCFLHLFTIAATGLGTGSGAASTNNYQSTDNKAGVGSVDF